MAINTASASPDLTVCVEFDPKGPVIQTATLIAGKDASLLRDDDIYELIRKAEAKIEGYNKIENKPKKLEAKIAGIKADIAELVKFVDERQ